MQHLILIFPSKIVRCAIFAFRFDKLDKLCNFGSTHGLVDSDDYLRVWLRSFESCLTRALSGSNPSIAPFCSFVYSSCKFNQLVFNQPSQHIALFCKKKAKENNQHQQKNNQKSCESTHFLCNIFLSLHI